MKTIVLIFHSFNKKDKYSISFSKFKRIIRYFKKRGSLFSKLEEITEKRNNQQVCFTFDDGDISQYEAFKILKRYKIPGNFFIITDKIGKKGYLSEKQIKEMSDTGMCIGSHTKRHMDLRILSVKDLKRELEDSKKKLQGIIKKKVESIAIPGGVYKKKVLRECLKSYRFVRTSDVEVIDKGIEKQIFPGVGITNSFKMFFLNNKIIKVLSLIKEVKKIKNIRLPKANTLFHLHTNYSDGKYGLKDLATWCKKKGIKYVFITEHAHYLNDKKWKRYVFECNSLSNKDLIFFPYIEMKNSDGSHLVYMGSKELQEMEKEKELIKNAKKKRIPLIIAHANLEKFPEEIKNIEIWNGKFHPKAMLLENFVNLNKVKRELPSSRFYAGADMHYLGRGVIYTNINPDKPKEKEIMRTFLEEDLIFFNKDFAMSSEGEIFGKKFKIVFFMLWYQLIFEFKKRLRKIKVLKGLYNLIRR